MREWLTSWSEWVDVASGSLFGVDRRTPAKGVSAKTRQVGQLVRHRPVQEPADGEVVLIRNGLGSGSLDGCERSGGGRTASVAVGVRGPADGGAVCTAGGTGPRGRGRDLRSVAEGGRQVVGEVAGLRAGGAGHASSRKAGRCAPRCSGKRRRSPCGRRSWTTSPGETWPKIRAKAKTDGGEILFADHVGIRSDRVTGRTWGEKGKTPVVRRSGNQFSVLSATTSAAHTSATPSMKTPRVSDQIGVLTHAEQHDVRAISATA